jgi:uncharacterized membrane protein
MGSEEQPNPEAKIELDLAALAARVAALEQALSQLGVQPTQQSSTVAPPPPKSIPSAKKATLNLGQSAGKPSTSLEDRIGSQLFSRIGIVALLIAITLFLKWAIDNQWIGPTGRIVAGLLAGVAVVLWSERFRRQGFHAFSYALKAIGSGALYLSLWASFQLYHLLPAEAALAAMILVTAWNAYMAWSQNSELLAAYALAGAFATPTLLSTGGNHEVFLFLYTLVIDIATVALVRLKPWPRLLLGAFPATVAFFLAWYIDWYGVHGQQRPFAITTLFLALFFLTFLLPSIYPKQSTTRSNEAITEVLLPIANAVFAALALYNVLQDSGYSALLPWIAVLFAAIYLGLMRLPQTRTTSAVHLSLAVVFLTIAIPLKASGRSITVGWLAEGAALLWAASRLSMPTPEKMPAPEKTTAPTHLHHLLRRLAASALTLGLLSLFFQPYFEVFWRNLYLRETAFLNTHFATALFGLCTFAASAWIALHAPRHQEKTFPSWLEIAAASIIAFNLLALFAIVRELSLLWPNNTAGNLESDLQRSLAISAFLMLYGAALLAAGFWKRSAFIRWQALLLLVFTIATTFLYDLRNLSQGYRVLCFLGLGALLMAISFAYQKDWLALRNPEPTPPVTHEEANQ